jgi:hypothetical protein
VKLIAAVAVSLALNLGLILTLVRRPSLAPQEWRIVFGDGAEAKIPASSSRVAPSSHAARSPHPGGRTLWSVIATNDLRMLIERLRAAGFPPFTIRAIVNAEVDARFESRYHEAYGTTDKLPFWKPDMMSGGFSRPEQWEKVSRLYRERSQLLRELLGDDIGSYAADPTAEQRRRFGNLPAPKIARLQQINDDYDEMEMQLRSATQGITLPEDREKFALLQRERKADLAAILSPQELEEYEMRSNWQFARLRQTMTLMDATEAEFRAIFRAEKAREERLRNLRAEEAVAAGAYRNDPSSAEVHAMAMELKAALGEQRYAEYSRASNNEFQQLSRIGQRDNVPQETLLRAFSVRDHVAHESGRIFDDGALTLEQKRAALQSLAQRARTEILSTLGPKSGPDYAQSLRWLPQVERGAMVTFGPENTMSTKRLPEPRAAAGPKG